SALLWKRSAARNGLHEIDGGLTAKYGSAAKRVKAPGREQRRNSRQRSDRRKANGIDARSGFALLRLVVQRCFEAPAAHRVGEGVEQRAALFPADAGVRNALPVDEIFPRDQILASGFQMALDHDAENRAVAGADLRRHVGADRDLALGVLGAVA